MIKRISTTLLAILLAICLLPVMPAAAPNAAQAGQVFADTEAGGEEEKEVKGLWLSFVDFEDMDLKSASAKQYRSKIRKLLTASEKYGTNTVYFHVRAFDDAAWKSKTFKAMEYLSARATSKKTAAATYTYDPLKIAIEECHAKNMKIEAWLNPYRITHKLYLNPASTYSTNRIKRAVNELRNYDLDGIHFDDYFYHSGGKYRTPTKESRYAVSVKGTDSGKTPSEKEMRSNVNKMVREVYKSTHKKEGMLFGISPQGNYENCMASGCDVKTWLKESGYVDYIAPQIYWSDQWGSDGKTTMFSDRLSLWKNLNKNGTTMLIGLALYRTGDGDSGDRGWDRKSTNLREQVKKLRKAGCKGYILFRAMDLYRKGAAKELNNLQALVAPVRATTITAQKSLKVKVGKTKKIKVKFTPENTNPKTLKYSSSAKAIATVSKQGKVKGKSAGKAVITVKAAGGAKTKVKVTVTN